MRPRRRRRHTGGRGVPSIGDRARRGRPDRRGALRKRGQPPFLQKKGGCPLFYKIMGAVPFFGGPRTDPWTQMDKRQTPDTARERIQGYLDRSGLASQKPRVV